jgi:hypothetical protein
VRCLPLILFPSFCPCRLGAQLFRLSLVWAVKTVAYHDVLLRAPKIWVTDQLKPRLCMAANIS